jgi:hypothetical protein
MHALETRLLCPYQFEAAQQSITLCFTTSVSNPMDYQNQNSFRPMKSAEDTGSLLAQPPYFPLLS